MTENPRQDNPAACVPTASVIVCTYNRSAYVIKCLAALWPQAAAVGAECLVIDNNSTDDTRAVLDAWWADAGHPAGVRLLSEPAQGLSHARNTGLAAALAPVVIFLDDDAIPVAGWLAACIAGLDSAPDIAACGGPIRPIFEAARPDWLLPAHHGLYSILDLGEGDCDFPKAAYPYGANMAFNRTVTGPIRFDPALGRIGTSLLSGEEALVFRTITRNGGRVRYVAAMAVDHHIPAARLSPHWLRERYYYGGISERRVAAGWLACMRLTGAALLRAGVRQGQAMVTGNPAIRLRAACARAFLRGVLSAS
jgi:glycosyltransferase involved in cell wall biosynthesis